MKKNNTILTLLCPLILATAACSSSDKQSQSAMEKNDISASKQVSDAAKVVKSMEADPKMKDVMHQARGVFIVPHYRRAALGIGGAGGEGVFMMKRGLAWSDPAFYNVGGVSAGLQAGAEGGSLAFIMLNDKAVQQFKNKNNFQLNADAGLTVVNWSKMEQADLTQADAVAWSNSRGLFGGVAIGLQDIRFDQKDSSAFYGQTASQDDIFSGSVKAPEGKASVLKNALSVRAAPMSGSSSSSETDKH